jgi:hypothetical protein
MGTNYDVLLKLQEHSAVLSQVIVGLSEHDSLINHEKERNAAEWLDVAAGVCNVEVVTSRFDGCTMYCEPMLEHENARSELITSLVTQLTVFLFIWGAYETVTDIIDPPSIPPRLRMKGANSAVDRTIFFLKEETPLQAYLDVLKKLKELLHERLEYLEFLRLGALPPHMGTSGIGIDFVRKVRNKFAHGAAFLPMPDDWADNSLEKGSHDPVLIAISSRVVLFTIQMLLLTYYRNKHFKLEVFKDDCGLTIESDIHVVLSRLHLKYWDKGQLSFSF